MYKLNSRRIPREIHTRTNDTAYQFRAFISGCISLELFGSDHTVLKKAINTCEVQALIECRGMQIFANSGSFLGPFMAVVCGIRITNLCRTCRHTNTDTSQFRGGTSEAAPTAEATVEMRDELEKRDLSVYVCERDEWQNCNTIYPPWNICQPFSATGLPGYQSWGPGTGTNCLWYTGGSCTGTQSDAVNYPGYSTVPSFWQFNTASFKCWN